jgi:hypothetical protein
MRKDRRTKKVRGRKLERGEKRKLRKGTKDPGS